MSQEPEQGDDLDLSALEAAVANLGLDNEDGPDEAAPAAASPGLDLTEAPTAPQPPETPDSGVSVFDAPDLPEGIEIPDFSGASLVGSAADEPDPDPFDDGGQGSSSGVLPEPPEATGDAGDGFASATDALRDLGAADDAGGDAAGGADDDADDHDSAPEPMASLPAPDPEPEPAADVAMIETFTAQGGRVTGPLKAVKGLFGR